MYNKIFTDEINKPLSSDSRLEDMDDYPPIIQITISPNSRSVKFQLIGLKQERSFTIAS